MFKMEKGITSIIVLTISLAGLPSLSRAEGIPTTRRYQIASGSYRIIGGLAPLNQPLPSAEQSIVEFIIDPAQASAQMTILGEDGRTVFRAFTNGTVSGDVIRFISNLPGPVLPSEGESYDYTVTKEEDFLQINGTVTRPYVCCDIPYQFTHTNVVAGLMPEITIRVSEVEICWSTTSNRTYQVQYRPALDPESTNEWIDLGPPVTGDGQTDCLPDRVPLGEPRRFYRVLTLPELPGTL
jgi:hypothetical protein